MNWLPPDRSLIIDYDNIVGLGLGFLDSFSLPGSTTDLTATETVHQGSVTNSKTPMNAPAWRDGEYPMGDSAITWNDTSPGTAESYVSSKSPHSAAHNISPDGALGGLYATSSNGARMPCTIRARRHCRLIPGARPVRPLNRIQSLACNKNRGLEFPDVSHLAVDDVSMISTEGSTNVPPFLSDIMYETIMQNFTIQCLNDGSSFPNYTASRFPGLSSLNLCVRLYFENFDRIAPVLHGAIVCINDHWLLALAVVAIGCQYAEADEYSQMVEPLHELLRRSIATELTMESLNVVARSRHGLAFAQAMVLSHVGMLYVGSASLLHFAKAQRSAIVELARTLSDPAIRFEFTQPDVLHGNNGETGSTSWELAMATECKRRIVCLIGVSQIRHLSLCNDR